MKTETGSLVQKWSVILFPLGFLALIAGMSLIMIGSARESSVESSFGGVVFIGPFPIVFGQGPQSPILLIIGLMIAIVMVLMFLSMLLPRRKVSWEE
ncbi:MAG: DUF131 domain-containing protein [Thaumarchaeota archaeon]|nr:DUF131 domain-containing protein [Nitrososphaerota archaeon]